MNQSGQQWVSSIYKPTVLVVGSGKAHAICRRNGVGLADMLKPFGARLGGGDGAVRFRTPNQGLKVVRGFGVQMVSPDEISQISSGKLPKLEHILSRYIPTERQMCDDIGECDDAERFFRRNPDPTPWFTAARIHLHRSLSFAPHEFTEQPIGMIVVVAANEDSPGQKLAQISALGNLPSQFASGALDGAVPCAYWVLHDKQGDVDLDKAQKALEQIERRYPNKCSLISINSAKDGQATKKLPDIWADLIHTDDIKKENKAGGIVRGIFLSQEDRKILGAKVSELVLKTLVPSLERKLAHLNHEVNEKRKGLGNTLKLMFTGRKSNRQSALSADGTGYHMTSIEAKIRQAADYALLMADYDTAAGHYRTAKGDYQHDKLYRLLATANELHGLCFLLSSGPRHGLSYIESAVQWYVANGDIQRATRAALWAADTFRTAGQNYKAALQLKRASERESHCAGGSAVRAALLVEQAAYMFLKPSNIQGQGTMIRKYAFHLIMAGHMYHKCKLHHHGVRCYASARCVFLRKRWFHVQDHIHYDLAKNLQLLRNPEQALRFFSKALNFETDLSPFYDALTNFKDIDDYSPCDEKTKQNHPVKRIRFPRTGVEQQQPAERQSIFLNELRSMLSVFDENSPRVASELKLPLILDAHTQVDLKVSTTLSPEIAKQAWGQVLFNPVAMSADGNLINTPLFDEQVATHKAKPENRHCVQHEPVKIRITIVNPLHTTLSVSNMRLRVAYSSGEEKPKDCGNELKDGIFVRSEVKMKISAKTRVEAVLEVTCLKEGLLIIKGVEWKLFDQISAYHEFVLPNIRRIESTTNNRKRAVSLPNPCLCVKVKGPAALLSFVLEGLPRTIYHTQVVKAKLKIKNEGLNAVSATEVQIKVSHPGFIAMCNDSEQPLEYRLSDGLIFLEKDIAPHEETFVTMYIRAAQPGLQKMSWLIKYQSTNGGGGDYRVAWLRHQMRALPLLSMEVFTRPSIRFAQTDSSLLMIMVKNATASPAAASEPGSGNTVKVRVLGSTMISDTFTIMHSEEAQIVEGQARKAVVLDSSESYNLIVRVRANDDGGNDHTPLKQQRVYASGQETKRFSGASFGTNSTEWDGAESEVVWRLLRMERLLDQLELKRKIMLNPNAFKDKDMESAVRDFDLMLKWECRINESKDNTARGYFLLRDQKCLNSLYSKNMSACPLKVMVRHPQDLKHDFRNGRLCVPVLIQVCNRRDDIAVSFVFETLPPMQEFDSVTRSFQESKTLSMQSRYFWEGATSQRIKNLGPNDQVRLKVYAVFHKPGQYNLNRFRFSVDMPNVGVKHFFFPLQHLVSVSSPC